jgi:hypothetical protein
MRYADTPQSIVQAGENVVLDYVLRLKECRIETRCCRECNHIYVTPSFDEDEIIRLYSKQATLLTKQQYRHWERISGQTWAELHGVARHNQESMLGLVAKARADALHDLCKRVLKTPADQLTRICDVGGMSGSLMSGFTHARRYVYDVDLGDLAEGVQGLSDLRAVASEGPYDMLIFSHVLEHIPEPVDFLRRFRACLGPAGLVYIEVPLEYCGTMIKRTPRPLTAHVNYFCPTSVQAMLAQSGFGRLRHLSRVGAWYGEQRMTVIKVLASASAPSRPVSRPIGKYWDLFRDSALTKWIRMRTAADIDRLMRKPTRPS